MMKESLKNVGTLKKSNNIDQEPIKFYRKNGEFGYFSNFYPSVFRQNKQVYKTAEHYFQSKKFQGKKEEQQVINSKTPSQAFKIGRDKKNPIRSDWQDIKEAVMMIALRLKFDQNPLLKRKLIETESRELIEHTIKDRYWGDGGDGTGKNRLGILLMKLRSEYQSAK